MYHKLVGTRINIYKFLVDNNIDLARVDLTKIDICPGCDTWNYIKDLVKDLDGNFICKKCEEYDGL